MVGFIYIYIYNYINEYIKYFLDALLAFGYNKEND